MIQSNVSTVAMFLLAAFFVGFLSNSHFQDPSWTTRYGDSGVRSEQQKNRGQSAATHGNGDDVDLPFIYGHVHIAKTAGTNLNGLLAAHYTRVCGNKGWSFDYYGLNERLPEGCFGKCTEDSLTLIKEKAFRGGIPPHLMDERGYEDCDYISHEMPWSFWTRFVDWPIPLELHVPCREPVDHLMSQCNYRNIAFECKEETMSQQVESCLVNMERYSHELKDFVTNNNNMNLKCFDNDVTFTKYMGFMNEKLQKRRIPVEDYTYRHTNKARNKADECIWKDAELREKLRVYLVENIEYYDFCDSCIGSASDLFRQK